jgi:hypothetical protein
MRIDFVEKRFALGKPRQRSVVHRIDRVLSFLVMVSPQRSRPVHPILIQCIKENMKRRKFLLVVVVIARDAQALRDKPPRAIFPAASFQ